MYTTAARFFGVISMVVGLSLGSYSATYAQESRLDVIVSPSSLTLTIARTQVTKQALKVSNNGQLPVNITMLARDIQGSVLRDYSIEPWIDFTPSRFSLQPDSSTFVEVVIEVPMDAEFGSHLGFLEASIEPVTPDDESWRTVAAGSDVATMLLLRVPGVVDETASLSSFTFKSFEDPKFTIGVENEGNVHIHPKGNITITDSLGVKRNIIEIDMKPIKPGESSVQEVTWDTAPQFGSFGAELELTYGDARNELSASMELSHFPIVFVVGLTFFAVTLIVCSILLYRRMHRHYGLS